jgi:hypothetical protein
LKIKLLIIERRILRRIIGPNKDRDGRYMGNENK